MAYHIDVDVKNPAVGSTEIGNDVQDETQNKLNDLMMQISKPEETENNLDSLNSVVGLPLEKDVEINNLILPPSDWSNIFKKVSEDDVKKMAASIYRYGLLHRITLWERDDNKYMILGGSTRYSAYRYLHKITSEEKWSEIPAKIYTRSQIDEIDAERIFIISNTDQRQMSTLNITNAYYNLIKLEKKKAFYGSGIFVRDAAAKQANVSPTTFNNYLKLIDLLPELIDKIDTEKLKMTAAYEIAFLPEKLQKYIFDKKYYLNLNRRTAKKIHNNAKTQKDIDDIISKENSAPTLFKYNIEFNEKLPDDCEILPLVVNKDDKVEIINLLYQAVSSSNFSNEVKNKLLGILR